MSRNLYVKLHVLIIDDFNSFRSTMTKNMRGLGFQHIDSVASAEEALLACRKQHYDIILADYNLGAGKNGQQLLEELRQLGLLKLRDVFILVSADTSRDVVMSTYDSEPDAYLTKPITAKALEQRLKRLLAKRNELLTVYDSLDNGDESRAIKKLKLHIQASSRYTIECQKILGEIYLQQKKYDLAELLYHDVLEVRVLDWAQVGLANVKMGRGDAAKAAEWLQDIINVNPSCLKAYDGLSAAHCLLGENFELQNVLLQVTEVSPLSVCRQKYLADTALANGDAELAIRAYRKTVKLEVNSIHYTPENMINLARAIMQACGMGDFKAKELGKDISPLLSKLDQEGNINKQQQLKSKLLNSQLFTVQDDYLTSEDLLEEAQSMIDTIGFDEVDIDAEIDMVNTLMANKKSQAAKDKLKQMAELYKDDQSILEKIDHLYDEPISKQGKIKLAKINKEGIDAYKHSEYQSAINYFSRATKKYPRFIGLKLNLIQSMIGSMKESGVNNEYILECRSIFTALSLTIEQGHTSFERYKQLQSMLATIVNTPLQQEKAI